MKTTEEVKIGTPGTVSPYTDCYPVTVVAVKGKKVGVTYDEWRIISGSEFDGSAEYEYFPRENGPVVWFSLRKNGRYIKVGHKITGTRLGLGVRRRHYDPHM